MGGYFFHFSGTRLSDNPNHTVSLKMNVVTASLPTHNKLYKLLPSSFAITSSMHTSAHNSGHYPQAQNGVSLVGDETYGDTDVCHFQPLMDSTQEKTPRSGATCFNYGIANFGCVLYLLLRVITLSLLVSGGIFLFDEYQETPSCAQPYRDFCLAITISSGVVFLASWNHSIQSIRTDFITKLPVVGLAGLVISVYPAMVWGLGVRDVLQDIDSSTCSLDAIHQMRDWTWWTIHIHMVACATLMGFFVVTLFTRTSS